MRQLLVLVMAILLFGGSGVAHAKCSYVGIASPRFAFTEEGGNVAQMGGYSYSHDWGPEGNCNYVTIHSAKYEKLSANVMRVTIAWIDPDCEVRGRGGRGRAELFATLYSNGAKLADAKIGEISQSANGRPGPGFDPGWPPADLTIENLTSATDAELTFVGSCNLN